MEDLKNDSKLCLRLMIMLSILFMVIFSKIGAYILGLVILGLNCWLLSVFCNLPFMRNYMITTLIGTIAFEIFYPIVFNSSKSSFNQSRTVFREAWMELKSRKTKETIN